MRPLDPDSLRSLLRVALCAAFALGSAATAGATSTVTYYDGLEGFGLAEQTALDSGIPIVPIDALELADKIDFLQDLDESSVTTNDPATATSRWNVANQRGVDLEALYIVFAAPRDHGNVDYDPTDVGLTLQSGEGGFDWIIFEVPANGDLYYYPAVSLGSLGDGQTTKQPFLVNYSLRNPQIFTNGEGFELGIPQWHLLTVSVPIPEPSAALLIATGVAALAAGRRRRP